LWRRGSGLGRCCWIGRKIHRSGTRAALMLVPVAELLELAAAVDVAVDVDTEVGMEVSYGVDVLPGVAVRAGGGVEVGVGVGWIRANCTILATCPLVTSLLGRK